MPDGSQIEVVRGRADAEELVRFWTGTGVLDEAAARARVDDVVCVLRAPDGAIAGVNSVYRADIALVGGRTFWVYRALLLPGHEDAAQAMLATAQRALDTAFVPERGDPIGLCLLVDDAELLRRRPQAVWEDPRLVYAGYLDDGRQVRIGYFTGAKVGR